MSHATTHSSFGAHGGVVFTPAKLARRMARLVPSSAQRILDPACGDGNLLFAARASGWTAEQLVGLELQSDHAERARARLSEQTAPSIRTCDALDPACVWPDSAWVLANPPWLSYSGRHASRDRSQRVRATRGWPSLQAAFLERIARYVADQRTGAIILLPTSVLAFERYAPVREAVSSLVRLAAEPQELADGTFESITEPVSLIQLISDERPKLGSPAAWLATSATAQRIEAVLAHAARMPARTFRDPGVHSGNSAKLLVRPSAETNWPALRQGRDLAPYALGSASARVRTDLTPDREQRFRMAALERYRSFPVLIRQTAERPRAALHAKPSYFRNSLLAAQPVEGLDPAFIVAVLNSPLAALWHRTRFVDARQRIFPQVKVSHLSTQPFPLRTRADNPQLHDEIARRVQTLNPRATEFNQLVRQLEQLVLDAFNLGRAPDVLALCRPYFTQ